MPATMIDLIGRGHGPLLQTEFEENHASSYRIPTNIQTLRRC
jgi:hypothetical protein